MTTGRMLYSTAFLGSWAGLVAWSITAPLPEMLVGWSVSRRGGEFVDAALLGFLLLLLGIAGSDRFAGRRLAAGRLALAALVGALAGVLAILAYGYIQERGIGGLGAQGLTVLAWTLIGTTLGLTLGLFKYGPFRVRTWYSATGGLLGALAASWLVQSFAGPYPFLAHAFALMLVGLSVALGSAGAVVLMRQATLRLERCTGEVEGLMPGREWFLLAGESITFVKGAVGRSPGLIPVCGSTDHRTLVPDGPLARVKVTDGRVTLTPDGRVMSPGGEPFAYVMVLRDERKHAWPSPDPNLELEPDDVLHLGDAVLTVSFSHRKQLRTRTAAAGAAFLLASLAPMSASQGAPAQPFALEQVGAGCLMALPPDGDRRPALRFSLNIVGSNGVPRALGVLDPQSMVRKARLSEAGLSVPLTHVEIDVPTARYAVLLLDVSGSMLDRLGDGRTKFDHMKEAARAFASGLSPGIDHVAVVPFASQRVQAQIHEARFHSSPDEVRAAIDSLPVPSTGNTALFSAIDGALILLADAKFRARRMVGGEKAPLLLVAMTDGRNDVGHRKDDPGLLTAPEGVIERAAQLQIPVITVGLGGPNQLDEATMARLGRGLERSYFPARDGRQLVEAFRSARNFHIERLSVTFRMQELFREQLVQPHQYDLHLVHPIYGAVAGTLRWAPPAGIVRPDFECSASPAEVAAVRGVVHVAQGNRWADRYWLVLINSLLAHLLLGVWLPRQIWAGAREQARLDHLRKQVLASVAPRQTAAVAGGTGRRRRHSARRRTAVAGGVAVVGAAALHFATPRGPGRTTRPSPIDSVSHRAPTRVVQATADADGILRLREPATGRLLCAMSGHRARIREIAIHPQGTLVASGSDDGQVSLWEMPSGRRVRTFEAGKGPVTCMAFSPDGKRLLSASAGAPVAMWDLAQPGPPRRFGQPVDGATVFFSVDGSTITILGADGSLRHFEVATGALVAVVKGEGAPAEPPAPAEKVPTVLATVAGDPDACEARIWSTPAAAPGTLTREPAGAELELDLASGPAFIQQSLRPDGRPVDLRDQEVSFCYTRSSPAEPASEVVVLPYALSRKVVGATVVEGAESGEVVRVEAPERALTIRLRLAGPWVRGSAERPGSFDPASVVTVGLMIMGRRENPGGPTRHRLCSDVAVRPLASDLRDRLDGWWAPSPEARSAVRGLQRRPGEPWIMDVLLDGEHREGTIVHELTRIPGHAGPAPGSRAVHAVLEFRPVNAWQRGDLDVELAVDRQGARGLRVSRPFPPGGGTLRLVLPLAEADDLRAVRVRIAGSPDAQFSGDILLREAYVQGGPDRVSLPEAFAANSGLNWYGAPDAASLAQALAILRQDGFRLLRVPLLIGNRARGRAVVRGGNGCALPPEAEKTIERELLALLDAAHAEGLSVMPVLFGRDLQAVDLLDPTCQAWLVEKMIPPLVGRLARHPGSWGWDVIEEPKLPSWAPLGGLQAFAATVTRRIHEVGGPGTIVTLGSRTLDEAVDYWSAIGLDVLQAHSHTADGAGQAAVAQRLPSLHLDVPVLLGGRGETRAESVNATLTQHFAAGWLGVVFWEEDETERFAFGHYGALAYRQFFSQWRPR